MLSHAAVGHDPGTSPPQRRPPLNPFNPEPGHIRIKAWGRAASFTRYDTPAERDTYPMLTVPAADAILSAVYWHPAFHYEITAISVLNEVRISTWHGNEMKDRPGRDGTDTARNRTPRVKRIIHDPAYLIDARIVLRRGPDHARAGGKIFGILRDRLARGQVREQPYFGLREYVCHVAPATGEETPWAADADLGPLPLQLRDIEDPRGPLILTRHHYDVVQDRWVREQYRGRVQASYFPGIVRRGVLHVPAYRSVE